MAKARSKSKAKTKAKTHPKTNAKRKNAKEPRDIAGWLVYADASIEAGDARAELIVVEERFAKDPKDKTVSKRRKALLKKHAMELKGPLARGVVAAGGGLVGERSIAGRIQDAILDQYSLAHLIKFALVAARPRIDRSTFEKKLKATLPDSVFAFHEWADGIATRFPDAIGEIRIPDGPFNIASLSEIKRDTEMWRRIQAEQPDREWRSGFVHAASWDGAYEMVFDTEAQLAKPRHQLFYWDFKGGSTYGLKYKTYDDYLKDVLAMIAMGSYFQPVRLDGKLDDEDDDEVSLYETWSDAFHDRSLGVWIDFDN